MPAITYFRAGSTIISSGCLTAVFGMGTGGSIQISSPASIGGSGVSRPDILNNLVDG
ncbi:unnamed protein product [Tuwongella immobilis]|uniref:Uncharacterized protein n=1 Tax=Tuwongella immobilis TaxID=692036 RepID=A0A6C2YQD8_9BACT|nr:unnamed protein product [Tuwongella immobilis]VTS03393.1 unnamed protein product [Tuwongella immobilis]